MTRLLFAAAALAACSPEPQRNASAAGAMPSAGAPAAAAPAAIVERDSGAVPKPGELKTFGDWTVGCDNTNACELRSLQPEDAGPSDVTISIARAAGPTGRSEVTLDGYEDDDLTTTVDGKPAETPEQMIHMMANGRVMAALVAGRKIAALSLTGASAALRHVDAVQGRVDTVTALVARGPKPASVVPAPPAAPVIVAVQPGGTPASASVEQLAAMRAAADCEAETPDSPEHHALGRGKTLVLLPCSSGAYNVSAALFVLDGAGFAPARTDAPVGFGETGAEASKVPSVVNGEFLDGVLTSYAKGRGMGDCGVAQEFVWDGARLRLSEQREMGECRGNIDYITTWRARVVRQ